VQTWPITPFISFAGKIIQLDCRENALLLQENGRPALYKVATDKESGYPTEGLGILSIAKHRNGETGNVYFSHNKSMTKIADYTPPME